MRAFLVASLLTPGVIVAGGNGMQPVTLLFGGDCLLAAHYERAADHNPNLAFTGFALLAQADIAMVNLECPITARGEPQDKPFTFRMRPDFAPALVESGIDVVNLANNHIYDFGEEGLDDTITMLDSLHVAHVGAGRNTLEAHEGIILRVRNIRIGLLGYYGGGESPKAGRTTAGVADRELEGIRADISRLRDSVDYLVVNFHWGDELAPVPSPSQIAFAHATIDAGADAVIGHHPHVLQGIENYHNGVIAYSLGNFVFGGNSRSSYLTALLEIRVSRDSTETALMPVSVDHWRVSLARGKDAEEVLQLVADRSRSFSRTMFNK